MSAARDSTVAGHGGSGDGGGNDSDSDCDSDGSACPFSALPPHGLRDLLGDTPQQSDPAPEEWLMLTEQHVPVATRRLAMVIMAGDVHVTLRSDGYVWSRPEFMRALKLQYEGAGEAPIVPEAAAVLSPIPGARAVRPDDQLSHLAVEYTLLGVQEDGADVAAAKRLYVSMVRRARDAAQRAAVGAGGRPVEDVSQECWSMVLRAHADAGLVLSSVFSRWTAGEDQALVVCVLPCFGVGCVLVRRPNDGGAPWVLSVGSDGRPHAWRVPGFLSADMRSRVLSRVLVPERCVRPCEFEPALCGSDTPGLAAPDVAVTLPDLSTTQSQLCALAAYMANDMSLGLWKDVDAGRRGAVRDFAAERRVFAVEALGRWEHTTEELVRYALARFSAPPLSASIVDCQQHLEQLTLPNLHMGTPLVAKPASVRVLVPMPGPACVLRAFPSMDAWLADPGGVTRPATDVAPRNVVPWVGLRLVACMRAAAVHATPRTRALPLLRLAHDAKYKMEAADVFEDAEFCGRIRDWADGTEPPYALLGASMESAPAAAPAPAPAPAPTPVDVPASMIDASSSAKAKRRRSADDAGTSRLAWAVAAPDRLSWVLYTCAVARRV
jgi:hypothetical protein